MTTREEFLGPDANFDVRGKSVAQLEEFVQRIDDRLLMIHQTAESELRAKSPAEQNAFSHGLAIRDEAVARIEQSREAERIWRSHPRAAETAYDYERRAFGGSGDGAVFRSAT